MSLYKYSKCTFFLDNFINFFQPSVVEHDTGGELNRIYLNDSMYVCM